MSDNWGTPEWIMEIFDSWYDPCPLYSQEDNLLNEWDAERIYINPPYSNPKPWVEKAIQTNHKYGSKIVMLLKHDSSTQWYRMLKESGARFLMIEGRLTYKGPNSRPCAFPSILAVLS